MEKQERNLKWIAILLAVLFCVSVLALVLVRRHRKEQARYDQVRVTENLIDSVEQTTEPNDN